MKTLAVTALSLFLVLSPSLAKTGTGTQVQASPKHSVLTNPMRMKSVLARAVPRAQRRLLVTNDLSDGDDGPPGPGELDLHQSYRRPELAKEHTVDDPELSDYVQTRLLIARVRALKKYQEAWA
jgi:hypothetical protein